MDSNKVVLTEELVERLKCAADGHSFWEPYLERLAASGPIPFSVHLAVLLEPYLQYILNGSKTVESRFSKNRIAPYNSVKPGDVILLKKASVRTVSGICIVRSVWFYQLDCDTWDQIRTRFSNALRAENPAFWEERQAAHFATLMRIGEVSPLPPVDVPKRDRRGWVVLHSRQQAELDLGEG